MLEWPKWRRVCSNSRRDHGRRSIGNSHNFLGFMLGKMWSKFMLLCIHYYLSILHFYIGDGNGWYKLFTRPIVVSLIQAKHFI